MRNWVRIRRANGSIAALAIGLGLMSLVAAYGNPGARSGSEGKALINVDADGLALRGYDPVAYFAQSKAAKGDTRFTTVHAGATYRFASEENLRQFEKNPDLYAPQFGGFCAYGVAKNQLAPSDPEAFQIVSGRLILQYDQNAVAIFSKDLDGNMAKARANWPGLVARHGK